MYVVLIMLGLLIAVGAAATLIWIDHRRSEQADRNVAMLRQELQALVGQQAQAISAQMGQLGQSMNCPARALSTSETCPQNWHLARIAIGSLHASPF